MAGESLISTGSIEKRAEDLEQKVAAEKAKEEPAKEIEGSEKSSEANPELTKQPETKPVAQKTEKKLPDDPAELRKWNTRVSMELAEVRKQLESLATTLSKKQAKPVDWKELSKDPVKLEKAIEAREQELISSQKAERDEVATKAAAEITEYESKVRSYDSENYPRWTELLPLMRQLSAPRPDQPNGDPRVNFNRHPKVVLDNLYELAVQIAETDPNYKKPEPKVTGKSYSQEEFDSAVAKAKEEALSEQEKNLRAENKGASVAGMGKGASKGKPGAVDKEALWNMPLADLKSAIQKASQ